MSVLHVGGAFLRKDWNDAVGSRAGAVGAVFGIVVTLFVVDALAEVIGPGLAGRVPGTNEDPVAFLLLGIAVFSLHDAFLREPARAIRRAKLEGTLEALLAAGAGAGTVVLCLPLFPVLRSLLRVAAIIALGIFLLAPPVTVGNLPWLIPTLAMVGALFAGLGLVFAALTIRFERTESLLAAYITASMLLAGVLLLRGALGRALRDGTLSRP